MTLSEIRANMMIVGIGFERKTANWRFLHACGKVTGGGLAPLEPIRHGNVGDITVY
jgi:hypothetical protein